MSQNLVSSIILPYLIQFLVGYKWYKPFWKEKLKKVKTIQRVESESVAISLILGNYTVYFWYRTQWDISFKAINITATSTAIFKEDFIKCFLQSLHVFLLIFTRNLDKKPFPQI